jgi:hypothetical protein
VHPNPGSHELEVGKNSINILMLSIAYRGISIPLFWVVLDLEGNSCAEDRIDLLKRVIERLFLIEQKIPFIIRVNKNSMVIFVLRIQTRDQDSGEKS